MVVEEEGHRQQMNLGLQNHLPRQGRPLNGAEKAAGEGKGRQSDGE